MSFTQRKLNRLKVWDLRTAGLKKHSRLPLIKNVDIEELKKQFTTAAPIVASKNETLAQVAE